MTKVENLYSERANRIIKDIERTHKKEIRTLLKKYPSDKDRDFIQKYVETQIAVGSLYVTLVSYIFALIAIVSAVLIATSPPNPKSILIPFYTIALIVLVLLLIWFLFIYKRRMEYIIIAIESDKLTSQKADNSEPTIYNSEGWYRK
jgi:hypothetical protein